MSPLHKPRSFRDAVIRERGHLIHRIKARDSTGRWAVYFIMVQPARERAFLEALKKDGEMILTDFGELIASCYGEEPTQEVRDFLKEKYGFDV